MSREQALALGGRLVQHLPNLDHDVAQDWIDSPDDAVQIYLGGLREGPAGYYVDTSYLSDLFRLTMDWNRTTEEMLRAGRYDRADENITEDHFPRPQTSGVVGGDYKLFHFDCYILLDNAVRGMGPEWTPAGPHETLAYGEKFPEIQRQFPIVGLGNPAWRVTVGSQLVVVLHGCVSGRYADLTVSGGGWSSGCRFLARRK